MCYLNILFVSIWITLGQAELNTGYCDISSKSCTDHSELILGEKYLFYDVNPPEGFNLRRDVYMRFAIMLAEAQKEGKRADWTLVLPPWHNLYHWRLNQAPLYWSHFFDVSSLKSFAPVVELHEVFSKSHTEFLKIDVLFILLNYEDPFENGSFEDKWETTEGCEYDGQLWGFNNITVTETICVKFQGKVSMLWELFSMHFTVNRIMVAHGEIPLHDSYGTKTYWNCRKSMKFNKLLVNAANDFIAQNLNCQITKCNSFISVHWRRKDFALYRSNDVPSIAGTVTQIDTAIKKYTPHIKKIYIATDASIEELRELKKHLNKSNYEVYYYVPNKRDIDQYKDGGIAIIDQVICSRSAFFIGTHESTFTFRIQEEREILGFESKTTFNRLCPDRGKCEEPSKWTIVN